MACALLSAQIQIFEIGLLRSVSKYANVVISFCASRNAPQSSGSIHNESASVAAKTEPRRGQEALPMHEIRCAILRGRRQWE